MISAGTNLLRMLWLGALPLMMLLPRPCPGQFFGFGQTGPQPPAVSLLTTNFTNCVNQGGILLAEVQSLEYSEKAMKDNWHHPDRYEVKVILKIDRAILGETPQENPLEIPSLWLSTPPEFNSLRPGVRVLYQYFESLIPEKLVPFDGPRLQIANAADIERLDRVAKLLAMQPGEAASAAVLAGCHDTDPYYARWCLGVTSQLGRVKSRKFLEAYGHLRTHLSAGSDVEMSWELLQSPETHSLVYLAATARLAREELSPQEYRRLYHLHIARLRQYMAGLPSDEDRRHHAIDEIRHLLERRISKMPIAYRLETIPLLREMSAPGQEIELRNAAARAAGQFHADGNQQTWNAVFEFYRDLMPLHNDEKGLGIALCSGFGLATEHELRRSQQIDPAILGHYEKMFVQADKRLAFWCCSPLSRYIWTAKKEGVKWPGLSLYVNTLLANTPHDNIRTFLRSVQREHALKPAAESQAL